MSSTPSQELDDAPYSQGECRLPVLRRSRHEKIALDHPLPLGSSQSITGPSGTMPVGLMVRWLP